MKSIPESCGWYLDEYDGERFWKHVYVGERPYASDPLATAKGDCWLWNGLANTTFNYPQFRINAKHYSVHRIALLESGRKIPDGYHVDHLCRIHSCVNPDHLEAVERVENVRRGVLGNLSSCRRGHEYTPENTKTVTRGGKTHRVCVTCLRDSKRRRYLRAKEKKAA